MNIIEGKTWTFGKNIDTDVIIPGRYLRTFNPQDLADHVLEGEILLLLMKILVVVHQENRLH